MKRKMLKSLSVFMLLLMLFAQPFNAMASTKETKTTRANDTIEALFPDAGMQILVAQALAKQPTDTVTDNDLKEVHNLKQFPSITYPEVNSLEGIDLLPRLSSISLSNGNLENLDALNDLQNPSRITNIKITNFGLKNIDSVQNLTEAKYIDFSDNQIEGISSIQNLTKLLDLNVSNNQISSLPNLSNVGTVYVGSSGLTLNLSNNPLTSLAEINTLSPRHCDYLDASGLKLNSQNEFANLTVGIKHLIASQNDITDISVFKSIPHLKFLDISNNLISDITPADTAGINMAYLDISNNKLGDLSGLNNIFTPSSVGVQLIALDQKYDAKQDVSSDYKLPVEVVGLTDTEIEIISVSNGGQYNAADKTIEWGNLPESVTSVEYNFKAKKAWIFISEVTGGPATITETYYTGTVKANVPPAPVYTVSYDANGAELGNVPNDTNNYQSGSQVTVLGNVGNPALSKANADFDGWNTQQNGTGIQYNADDVFTINQDVTLYAQWKLKPVVSPQPTASPTATPQPTANPTATPQPTANPTATPQPTANPTTTPQTSSKPTETQKPNSKENTSSPKTADNYNFVLWIGIMVSSISVLAIIIVKNRKVTITKKY